MSVLHILLEKDGYNLIKKKPKSFQYLTNRDKEHYSSGFLKLSNRIGKIQLFGMFLVREKIEQRVRLVEMKDGKVELKSRQYQ